MAIWNKKSGTKLAVLQERNTTVINLPVDPGATVKLLSGEIPRGMRLSGNIIEGTPFEVPRNTLYRFVLRASLNGETQDRTYNIEVQGADAPDWITTEGLLPIGTNGTLFVLDSSPIDFKLQVIDRDTSAGQELRYFLGHQAGSLPPGVELTEDGYLRGIVDPVYALEKEAVNGAYDKTIFDRYPFDFAVPSAQGYDSFYFDVTKYDIATPTQVPKKLNRYYQFRVSVTDGDSIADRIFRIFLVGDDFLRADNTIMQVGTGVFSSDNTFIRTPIWLTPSDLGVRRANNYITLFLDVLDPNSLVGVIIYELLDTNPDDTPSLLPPGTELDTSTGEIAGTVPYQPSVTETYTFTVRATRITGNLDEEAVTEKTFSVRLLGEVNSDINWITQQDLGEISANYISTLSVRAETSVPGAFLLYSLVDGRLPPGLELAYDGEIIGKINSYGSAEEKGLTVFDSANLVLDGNTTSIDRSYEFTVEVRDHFGYSSIQRTFTIDVTDPDDKLYTNIYYQPLLKSEQRVTYNDFVRDPAVFNPEYIYRPNDSEFGIPSQIKLLVYSGIETKLAEQYVAATALNSKRKNFKIGNLKTAVAKEPGTNNIIYEVVYLEVIDPYEKEGKVAKSITIKNNAKILVNSVRTTPNNPTYYNTDTSSVTILTRYSGNLKTQTDGIITVGTRSGDLIYDFEINFTIGTRSGDVEALFSPGSSTNLAQRPTPVENTIRADSNAVLVSDPNKIKKYISNISNIRSELLKLGRTERNFLPLWMRTAQEDSIQELGYTLALPLCYCKPGTSETIKAAINFSNFDYRQFELDIDRFLIDSTEGISEPKYIVFANYDYNL
jgi:hypothetical protein